MNISIGATLKNARKNAGLTVKDVCCILMKNDINIAEKTIYGWENDFSSPNVHIFLLLCKCYGIKDVLKSFGCETMKQNKDLCFRENEYSKEELDDIQKYAEFLNTKRK